MTTTYTPNADLALMGTGDEVDNWGVVQNNAIYTPIDGILGATTAISMTATDVTLTLSQWQSMAFVITGVLVGNLNLIFPLSPADSGGVLAVGGTRIIDNQTTGNFTITVKTAASGSTGVPAPQGYRTVVSSDTVSVNYPANSVPQGIVQNGVASATISSDQSDYSIATTVAYERLNVTIGATLTGIANGTAGRLLTLYNVGTATLILAANSSSSTSGNRFLVTKPIYLRPGAGIALQYDGTSTGWRPQNLLQADPPSGLFTNLAIKVATTTTATVTANNVTMTDGTYFLTTGALSATLNLGSAGSVNQLDTGSIASGQTYFVFAISNGITFGTLASLSATAPTLPSGYTFFARIGALVTASGVAQLFGTYQFGRIVQYVVGLAQTANLPIIQSSSTGTLGSDNALTAVSVAGNGKAVPSTASKIRLVAVMQGAGVIDASTGVMIAPNNSYGKQSSLSNPVPMMLIGSNAGGQTTYNNITGEITLETANIYIAIGSNGSGRVLCLGWEDNL